MPLNESQNLVAAGLSILRDPRPNRRQPELADGVHLRWAPGEKRGFPLYGYYLFRRTHREHNERCLSDFIGDLRPGELDSRELVRPYGSLQSFNANLLLTDDFPSTSYVELDLAPHRVLQFALPDQRKTSRVVVSIGFRRSTSLPSGRRIMVDWASDEAGDYPNPLIEDRVNFRALGAGGVEEPATRLVPAERELAAMVCNHRVEIALPGVSPYVDITVGSEQSFRIEAFNEDGSRAHVREMDPIEFGMTRMNGEAIDRVILEAPGGLLYGIAYQPSEPPIEVTVKAFSGDEGVAEGVARGREGEIDTVVLKAGGMTRFWISGFLPAALVELCYLLDPEIPIRFRADTVPGPWGKVPGFEAPLTLPITHPDYPASTGSESLQAWRARAEERIQHGRAEDYLSTGQRHVELDSSIGLQPGSAVVTGKGTRWDESLAGQLIYPGSLDTAFAVMTVLDPGRLVLSRPFTGSAPLDTGSYERSGEDTFAEIHDQLAALLSAPGGDMRGAAMPPVFDRSDAGKRVRLTDDSDLVAGENTAWTEELAGLLIELGADSDVYRIVEVPDNRHLKLDRPFTGDETTGDYRIVSRSPSNRVESESPSLDLAPMDLLELAALEPAYAQLLGLYWIDSEVVEGELYDYIVLADHGGTLDGDVDAALSWLNAHPDVSDEDVDGALVTEVLHRGTPALAAPRDLRGFALPAGHQRLDLERPDLADSEPGLSVGELAEWAERPLAKRPVMLQPWRRDLGPKEPDRATVPGPETFQPLGDGPRGDRFLVSAAPDGATVPRPEGWPDPRTIHYLDPALDVGWYAYRLHAIDLFGRYSVLSEAIPWYGVAPVEERHPYAVHLEDLTPPPPPTDVVAWVLDKDDPSVVEDDAYRAWRQDNPDALGLRVRWRWPWTHALQAPDLEEFRVYYQPLPINARPSEIVSVQPAVGDAKLSEVVLAFGDQGNPADAYHGAALQSGSRSFEVVRSRPAAQLELVVLGGGPLRDMRPEAGAEAALVLPDGHPLHRDPLDPLNWRARLAHVRHRNPDNATVDRRQVQMVTDESVVTYDADNALGGDDARWNGTWVKIRDLPAGRDMAEVRRGIDVLALNSEQLGGRVLEIAAVRPQRREIKPVGPPPEFSEGRYSWSIGPPEQLLEGAASSWDAALRALTLDGVRDLSRVRPGIDVIYLKVNRGSTPARLGDYFGIERTGDGGDRLVLADDSPGQLTRLQDGQSYAWKVGWPLRTYELFLSAEEPADPSSFTVAQALATSLAEPVVYGTIGVSAVDRRAEVPDRRTFAEQPRPGNEGQLGGPATVFRVHREEPDAPADIDWGDRRLIATKADYHGKSYFTVRWAKPTDPEKRKHYKAHVFRAMDQTLYMVDLEHKNRTSGVPNLDDAFPSHWPEARKDDVEAELEEKYGSLASTDDYDDLSDDTLSVLANLERNEEAFSQITIEPLDHTDPANNDRLGPDDEAGTVPDPNRAAFLDSMDGRSTNRYFYRIAFVDPGQNLGPLGKSTPPVYLPKVVPLRAPVIISIRGGERQINLRWARNREADLYAYRVYRAKDVSRATDIRTMELVQDLPADILDLNADAVSWTDSSVTAGMDFHYRVTALDSESSPNESAPSRVVAGRAIDTELPVAPEWVSAEWVIYDVDTTKIQHWPQSGVIPSPFRAAIRLILESADDFCTIYRRMSGEKLWQIVAVSVAPIANQVVLLDTEPSVRNKFYYRAIASNAFAATSRYSATLGVEPR